MTNILSSSRIKASRIKTIYTVEEARTPEEFAQIESNIAVLPADCIVIMAPIAEPEKVRLTTEPCTWEDAHPIGGDAGNITMQDVDDRIVWFTGTLTVNDDTTEQYSSSMLDELYPDKPPRFEVICENIQTTYRKGANDSWYAISITPLP